MTAVDKAALLVKRVGEVVPYDLPDVGTVMIRGLSRAEVLDLRRQYAGSVEFEQQLLALALVEPALTADEVATWQVNAPAGEIEPLTGAINELSGMGAGSAKAAYLRFRGRSGA